MRGGTHWQTVPFAPEDFFTMLQQKNLHDRIEHTVLFIGENVTRRATICNFLASAGCKCVATTPAEAPTAATRSRYNAILLDAAQAPGLAEQALFALREARPSLAEKIVVIAGPRPGAFKYSGVQVISQDCALPQLWAILQKIFSSQQSPVPAGMQAARLLFDSLRSPRSQGIRGALSSARQLAFQHDSTTINLLIHYLENTRLMLAGQVLDLSMRVVHDLPVLLSSRSATLAQTTTSQFGEFSFEEVALSESAGLQIRLAEGSWIYMPLKDLGHTEN